MSFEFIWLYSTKSIHTRSVITAKTLKNINIFISQLRINIDSCLELSFEFLFNLVWQSSQQYVFYLTSFMFLRGNNSLRSFFWHFGLFEHCRPPKPFTSRLYIGGGGNNNVRNKLLSLYVIKICIWLRYQLNGHENICDSNTYHRLYITEPAWIVWQLS